MSDLFTPDQDQRSQQADRPDPDTDPEAPLEAAREGFIGAVAVTEQCVRVREGDGRKNGRADCTADLLRRVDQARCEPSILVSDAREPRDRDRNERERDPYSNRE